MGVIEGFAEPVDVEVSAGPEKGCVEPAEVSLDIGEKILGKDASSSCKDGSFSILACFAACLWDVLLEIPFLDEVVHPSPSIPLELQILAPLPMILETFGDSRYEAIGTASYSWFSAANV